MSLDIYLRAKDNSLNTKSYEAELIRDSSFGPESWRKYVWGHPITETIGCQIIQKISVHDLYLFDDEVVQFEKDLKLLLVNLDKIDSNIDYNKFKDSRFIREGKPQLFTHNKASIGDRIINGLDVVRIAKKYKNLLGVAIT